MEAELTYESAPTQEVEFSQSEESEEEQEPELASECACPVASQPSFKRDRVYHRLAVSDYMLAMAIGALLPEVVDLFFYFLK
jgi:hypothetical protein